MPGALERSRWNVEYYQSMVTPLIIRVIVAGSRDFDDVEYMRKHLTAIIMNLKKTYTDAIIEIVSGGARGADWLAEKYAEYYKFALKRMPADWNQYGSVAGPIRNQEMLDYACQKIPVLVAFWDGKSSGTRNMISISRNAGILVHVFYYMYSE